MLRFQSVERGRPRSAPRRRCRRWRPGCRRRRTRPPRRRRRAATASSSVTFISTARTTSLPWRAAKLGGGLGERAGVDVGQHDAGALGAGSRSAVAAPMPPAPPVTSAMRPARLFGFGMRWSLASSSSQYSMSKASCSGRPRYSRDRRGAAHHVDGVDVELARDARRRLVLGEGDHADAGHQVDDRVRVAHRRAVGVLAALVVGGVVGAVGLDRRRQAGERRVEIGLGRVEVDDQRADLGAQEMVGAGGAERRQRRHVARRRRTPAPPAGRRSGRPCARPSRSGRGSPASAAPRPRAARLGRQRRVPRRRRRPACRRSRSSSQAMARVDDRRASSRSSSCASSPQVKRPWLSSTTPFASGFSRAELLRATGRARSPAASRAASRSRRRRSPGSARCEFFEAAMAMIASGCMWSTWRVRHVGVQRRVDRGGARVEVEGAVGQVAHHLVLVRRGRGRGPSAPRACPCRAWRSRRA